MTAPASLRTWSPARGLYVQKAGIYVFLISITSLFYLLNAAQILGHYDLGWHLAAGDLIRHQGRVPFGDPWSFTSGGRQWFNLSWLWDVFASLVFHTMGFGGLLIFTVVCGAIIVGYLASICLRTGASSLAVTVSVFLACLLYPAFVAYPNVYLAAAPNVATMLFSVIFYGACLARTKRVLWLLPAAMVLWANLHGGFLLGLFIIGVFGGVALLRLDWDNFKIYSFAGIGCFIATFVNPLGWHIYEGAACTIGNSVQAHITEWAPYYRNITLPGSIPGIVYIFFFVAFELRYRGYYAVEARLLSWLFLFLGLYQFRYMSFFYLFSAVPLSLHLDRLLPKQPNNFNVERSLFFGGIVAACVLPFFYLQAIPAFGLPEMLSAQDVRYLEAHFPRARLLNHWNYGGILIFRMRGAIPVFVDGRAATAYPDALLRDYFKLARPEVDEGAWEAVLEKYKIDTVLWPKTHEALRRFLVGEKGWKEAYTGSYASIYVKP